MIGFHWRQLAANPWPALLLALTTALCAALAVATPRLIADIDDRQLAETMASLSAIQGDIAGTWAREVYVAVGQGLADGPWADYERIADEIRRAQPEPLRSLLRPPQILATLAEQRQFAPPPESGYFRATLTLFVDRALPEHAVLVDGSWPRLESPRMDDREPVEVAIVEPLAQRMGWARGTVIDGNFVVSAVYRPADPTDTRWEHVFLGRSFGEKADPNLGVELLGGLFLSVDNAGFTAPVPGLSEAGRAQYALWYGLDAGAAAASGTDVALLSSQVTGMQAVSYGIVVDEEGNPSTLLRLNSELNKALDRVAAQQRTTRAMIASGAAGPLGVALALVALAARLVVARRREAIRLLLARGLREERLRRGLALEGLCLGLPAAGIGALAGNPLIGAVVAVLPAVALALAARGATTCPSRADLTPRAGRWRRVAEALAGLGAVAATWRLLSRAAPTGADVDLLAAATPLLVALAACLLVARLYPLPLHALLAWFARGRGVTGFLGSARALRGAAGGLVPVVAVVLGTTMAVMSAALLGTVVHGTERATWLTNGSSIHVSGPRLLDAYVAQIRALDGVVDVARIHEGAQRPVKVFYADRGLLAAYAAAPGGGEVPEAVFDGGAVPAVVAGGDAAAELGDGTLEGLGPVRVAAHLDHLPGVLTGPAWVLADVAHRPADQPLQPATTALVATAPGTDNARVAERIADIVGPARITTVDAQLAELRGSPTVDGLTRGFTALAAVTAGLMAIAILGAQLLTGEARAHVTAVLRTLGLRPRQVRALTAWELGPAIAASLLVGVGLGIALAALLLRALDVRALTGGGFAPPLYLDPLAVGGVVGGLLATVTVAVGLSAWFAGRRNLAQELRIGEAR